MQAMYPGIPFSPSAVLTQTISTTDTVIHVDDVSVFPPAPNYATIGTDEQAETIKYSAIGEGTLSGCTRAVEGTAQAWQEGEIIARNFTAKDLQVAQENITSLDGGKADKVSGAVAGNIATLTSGGGINDSGENMAALKSKVEQNAEASYPMVEASDSSYSRGLVPGDWFRVTGCGPIYAISQTPIDRKYVNKNTALAKRVADSGGYYWNYIELNSSIPLTFRDIRRGKVEQGSSKIDATFILGGNFILVNTSAYDETWNRYNLSKSYNAIVTNDAYWSELSTMSGYVPYNVLLVGDGGYATSIDGVTWTETAWPFTLPSGFSPCCGAYGNWTSGSGSIVVAGNAANAGSRVIVFNYNGPSLSSIGMTGYWNSVVYASPGGFMMCNNNLDKSAVSGMTSYGVAHSTNGGTSWSGVALSTGGHWKRMVYGYIYPEGENRVLLFGDEAHRYTSFVFSSYDTPAQEKPIPSLNGIDFGDGMELKDIMMPITNASNIDILLLCAHKDAQRPGTCYAYYNGYNNTTSTYYNKAWTAMPYNYSLQFQWDKGAPSGFKFQAPMVYSTRASCKVGNTTVTLYDTSGAPLKDGAFGKGCIVNAYYPQTGKLYLLYDANGSMSEHIKAENPHHILPDAIGAIPQTLLGNPSGVATLNSSGKVMPEQRSAPVSSLWQTSNTLALSHAGAFVYCTSTSATTVTIPNNSSVAFPSGTEIEIMRYAAGSVTIAAASGVTIKCASSSRTIKSQYCSVRLKKMAANDWWLSGDLT